MCTFTLLKEIKNTTLNSKELIELQLELECKRVVDDNTLIRIPCAHPDDIPRFLVAHHDSSFITFFHHDLPTYLRSQLTALSPEQAYRDYEKVKAILAQEKPCEDMWHGTSYIFTNILNEHIYPDAVRLYDDVHHNLLQRYERWKHIGSKTVYGIIVDGQIVASCGSSRENEKSAEAWVITEPAFRRRSYARQVTVAWARDIQQQGKVAFYSHDQSNLASQAVARSLGLISFVEAVAYV